MLFRANKSDASHVWVDRGIDGRVDDFRICEPCNADLLYSDLAGERWHRGDELCPECRGNFALQALATDMLGLPRPFNGMLEDRVLSNDELDADPPGPNLRMRDYFSPG